MTYADFIQECSARTIHVSVALDNEDIKDALKARDDAKVLELLEKEF